VHIGRGWRGVSVVGFATATALLVVGTQANAAIVPTVPLLTAGNYSVLGAETVTNTGPSVLNESLGLSPGTGITGFPPGIVNPPGTTDTTNAAAAQGQLDLTAAYLDAAGRPVDATEPADLGGLLLVGGVYAAAAKAPLSLTGTLTLDGAGDPNSVFIFQTDSTLITATGSVVSLINGAQECNVFWQIGSSATLFTGSTFVGNIMALTSISVQNSVTVHGRALARTGAVTLDTDTFTVPTCNLSAPVATTVVGGGTSTTVVGGSATTVVGGATSSIPPLPGTGRSVGTSLLAASFAVALGVAATFTARRKILLKR
jgi:Ice-binding-like